ncbi:hypothetical protein BURPS1710b_3602 [Burkholderia pseudomallei 1710b]|uniref:Uncharacterized protein n=1 Tax=Burkholderia pseudomallei (strain 1710b) TaxID=320372 RepID=Q3JN86_BURP1|nr:hypothetical protein BURPS1710b_3602 [Burkholderia pseudomallei 1710b]
MRDQRSRRARRRDPLDVRLPPDSRRRARAARVRAAAIRGGAPRVSRRVRARFDGARRNADPRPDEERGTHRVRGGFARHLPEPAVPAHVRGREGSARHDRDRRAVGVDGGRGRAPRAAHLRAGRAAARAVHRRGRDDRALRDPLRRAGPARARRREPHRRARREARRALRRPRDAARRSARAHARVRHHRVVHGIDAADHRSRRRRARGEGAPPPADLHGRPRGAARHRARSRQAEGRVPLYRRRSRRDRARRQCVAAGGRRAGRGDHRDARAEFHAVARRTQHRARDPSHAYAGGRVAPRGSRARAQDARARRRSGRRARCAVASAHQQADSRPDERAQPRERRRSRFADRPDARLLPARAPLVGHVGPLAAPAGPPLLPLFESFPGSIAPHHEDEHAKQARPAHNPAGRTERPVEPRERHRGPRPVSQADARARGDRPRRRALRAVAPGARRRTRRAGTARRRLDARFRRGRAARRARPDGPPRGRAADDAAAEGPERRAQHLRRNPRGHGRRRIGAVRGRPAADVPALRGAAALAGRDDVGEPVGSRRLQGSDRADRGLRRVLAPEVRIGRPPRAARARDRDAGPHPYVRVHGRGDARGRRDRRSRDQSGRFADRHVPRVGRGRPAHQQDRFGGARHAHPDGNRRRVPGRPLAAQEQGSRAEGARRADQGQAVSRAAREGGSHAQEPDRLGRPLRADPHVQLPAGPDDRSPDQPDAVQARTDHGRRSRRADRRARERAPGRAARLARRRRMTPPAPRTLTRVRATR